MKKQYIKVSNEAPNLGLTPIMVEYLGLRYFHCPQWTFGVWGLLSMIAVITFFVRIFTEEGIDVVERK